MDDDGELVETVKAALEETGSYDVKGETRGTKAVSAARTYKPDLIILDIMMPDMPGNEVARDLKDNEWTKHIPIAYFTVIVCKDDMESTGGMIGGHRFIPKPSSIDDLVRAIEETISQK